MKFTAAIPIRKGSERVPNKSLRPFARMTLLDIKIQNLLKVNEIDEIIVNTNSEKAIGIGKSHNITPAEKITMHHPHVLEVNSLNTWKK